MLYVHRALVLDGQGTDFRAIPTDRHIFSPLVWPRATPFVLDLGSRACQEMGKRSNFLKAWWGEDWLDTENRGNVYRELMWPVPIYTARGRGKWGNDIPAVRTVLGEEGASVQSAFRRQINMFGGLEPRSPRCLVRKHSRPVGGVDMSLLMVALQILAAPEHAVAPTGLYQEVGLSLGRWVSMAAYLQSRYLLFYGAEFLVRGQTISFYCGAVIRSGLVNSSSFRDLLDTVQHLNQFVAGKDMDVEGLITAWDHNHLGKTAQISWDFKVKAREISQFWQNQLASGRTGARCLFCARDLRGARIRDLHEGVQILSCCLRLACWKCATEFLLKAVGCLHLDPSCRDVVTCVMRDFPWGMDNPSRADCPNCLASYRAGIFSLDEFTHAGSGARPYRGSILNLFEITLGLHREQYLVYEVLRKANLERGELYCNNYLHSWWRGDHLFSMYGRPARLGARS